MVGERPVVRIEREGRIGIIVLDNPPVNALSQGLRAGMIEALCSLGDDTSTDAVVLIGAGRDFIAGADLREMASPPSDPQLPQVMAAIEACPKPVLAAIGGSALGGGAEIALACDLRVMAAAAGIGFPEVRLGIIPGSGGTQRLPRLVGPVLAVELVTSARRVEATEALSVGLVDQVASGDLRDEAVRAAAQATKRRVSALPVPAFDFQALHQAATQAQKRSRGVPAIAEAARLVRRATETGFAEGLAEERATFLRLRASDEAVALRHLFFAEREAAKVPGLEGTNARPVGAVAVIGGGTMGAGIAAAAAAAGFPVRLIERDQASADAGRARAAEAIGRSVASGRVSREAADAQVARIVPGADYAAVAEVDLVIEAVFEDLEVKRAVFAELDRHARPGTVLASNTSYLDLDAIAGFTKRPGDVLGLHFFSPANVMRLLEVVRGAATAPEVLATGLTFARRLNKIAVVARPCEGFIGNRIWKAYRAQLEFLLEEGASPEQIDAAMTGFGFPMGPFQVFDLSGLDIAWAQRKRAAATRDPAARYVRLADLVCESGRLGRKTGAGWYRYPEGTGAEPDPWIAELLASERRALGVAPRDISTKEIVARGLATMVNEGASLLEEGIAARASDIDVVLTTGYGFPAVKGGPMHWADRRGLAATLTDAEAAVWAGGKGWSVAPLLRRLASEGRGF